MPLYEVVKDFASLFIHFRLEPENNSAARPPTTPTMPPTIAIPIIPSNYPTIPSRILSFAFSRNTNACLLEGSNNNNASRCSFAAL